MVGREISFYSISELNTWNWNTENGRDKSTVLSLGKVGSLNCFILGNQVCGWIDGGTLSCSDPETTSGVRMYSLRSY